MKKLLYLLFAICLTGCGSDDDGISDTDGTDTQLLVKSINWTFSEGGPLIDYGLEEFTYDGNKIVQVVRTLEDSRGTTVTHTVKYIYTDNLISRISSYNNNQELQEQTFLEYDNSDRLIYIEVSRNGQLEYDASLAYGSSNTSFAYTATGVSDVFYTETTKFQISNGNIVSFEGNGIDAQSMNCSYDNKHNPFKNIIGRGALHSGIYLNLTESREIWDYCYGENNIVAFEYTDNNEVSSRLTTYDYNDEDYPRNIVTENSGTGFSETIIEYY